VNVNRPEREQGRGDDRRQRREVDRLNPVEIKGTGKYCMCREGYTPEMLKIVFCFW
jgi:hypothetical protein